MITYFKPEKISPNANEITVCALENWPDGKRKTNHYKAFDRWIKTYYPFIKKAKYDCWYYQGFISYWKAA